MENLVDSTPLTYWRDLDSIGTGQTDVIHRGNGMALSSKHAKSLLDLRLTLSRPSQTLFKQSYRARMAALNALHPIFGLLRSRTSRTISNT